MERTKKLSNKEEIALAIIKARPGILGRELEQALHTNARTRYAAVEGLRDKLLPIVGNKSGNVGYRIARTKEEWDDYEKRERADCIKRLQRLKAIREAALWEEYRQ